MEGRYHAAAKCNWGKPLLAADGSWIGLPEGWHPRVVNEWGLPDEWGLAMSGFTFADCVLAVHGDFSWVASAA